MMTDDEIRADLEKLKTIVAQHKATDAPLAVETVMIEGRETPVFSRVPANLGALYELGLAQASNTFLVYQQERYSFGETLDMARRLARVLRDSYGINKGDRVAICARNSPEWCIAYMGITLLGAIVVPMNSWWQGPELEYGLNDSDSRLVFVDQRRLDLLQPLLAKLDVAVVAIKPQHAAAHPEFYDLISHVEPLDQDFIANQKVVPEDDASIMYTSGSTGMPKGVLSTHRAIINALYTWLFVKEITEILRPELVEENPPYQPAMLCNVPLFHVTGSHAQFLASFVYMRKFVMMYKWDAEQALELIESERISVLHGVPTMTWEVMQSPRFATTDLSSLRTVAAGGAPRPPEHLALMEQKFPAAAIPGLGYGLTETNAIGAIISGKFYQARPDSTGRPSPPVTSMRIVSEAGEELGPNQVGEICIKGPTLMKGYWKQPEATAEVLQDGWFRTGDVGYLDTLGFLIISDRAKDIVIRGGENIGCSEVEYAITEHPSVNEVSVYGIPDDRLGEVPCATVMLKSGTELSAEDLKQFLDKRIAHFKIPEQIFLQHEQLPRIATGKIAKKMLRQQAIDRLAGA